MTISNQIREIIFASLRALDVEVSLSQIAIDFPERSEFGDYTTNIALVLKGGRPLAEKIAEKVGQNKIIKKIEVAGGGFLNIWVQFECIINEISRVISESHNYGRVINETKKTAVVDYSAPNIAKPFGIGHLRSTIIGQALYNLLAFQGYNVVGDNHLGDWGTQFGKLLYMIAIKQDLNLTIEKLEEWYVEFHTLAKDNPALENEARLWFKKLEDGDKVARALWQECVDISMTEYKTIYDLLGVKVDYAYGESFYESYMPAIIAEAKQKGVAHESQGALVIDIPGSEAPLMLVKSDGATTYATRDLATIKFRMATWNPEMIVYEVGNEQTLHFIQVFAAARMLGYVSDTTKLIHTRHGLYLAPDGKKFSTRKGKTVKLEAVLEEAIERAKTLGDVNEDTSRVVGVGAIKYFDLSHNITSDIVFEWETIMALAGNSGPYIQYCYARTQSICEKAGIITFDLASFMDYQMVAEEERVMKLVVRFGEIVEAASSRLSPNLLSNYLFELSQQYNSFYNSFSVLSAEKPIQRNFRILLTQACGQILKNGLTLLGIEAPERM